MKRKVVPFKLYAQILIFAALVFLGALVIFPLQRAVQYGMVNVRDNLISQLEEQINRQILFSSISPSIFGVFDVRDIRVVGDDGEAVLAMSRLRVSYSLLDLILGRNLAIRSLRLDSPFIDLNTVRDQDLFSIFDTDREFSLQSFLSSLPDNLQFSIFNGRCLIQDGDNRFEIDSLYCIARVADGRIDIETGWELSFLASFHTGEPVSLRVAMTANGSFRTDLEEGEALVHIPSVDGSIRNILPVSFGFSLSEGVASLQKMTDDLPFDFSLTYRIADESFSVLYTSENFRMGDLFYFTGNFEGMSSFLNISSSGYVALERSPDGGLRYSANLSGSDIPGNIPLAAANNGAFFELVASGDEREARIETARFSIPAVDDSGDFFYGSVSYNGLIALNPFSLAGTLSMQDFSFSGEEGINAAFTFVSGDDRINVSSPSVSIGRTNLSDFRAGVTRSEESPVFTVSALSRSNYGRDGRLSLEGVFNQEARTIEAGLRLNSFSASDIVNMTLPFVPDAPFLFNMKEFLDSSYITTDIYLATDFNEITYNVPRFAFNGREDEDLNALLSFAGTNRNAVLNTGRITRNGQTVTLTGNADFETPGNITFSANASYGRYSHSITGAIANGRSISIRGSYGLNVSLYSSDGRSFSGLLSADGFPVPFLGDPAFVSFNARLSNAPNLQSLYIDRFEVSGITSPAGPATVRLSGRVNENGADFPALFFQDRVGPLDGSAVISRTGAGFNGSVSLDNGRETYHLEGGFSDGSLQFALSGTSMNLSRLTGSAAGIFVDGNLSFSGDSADSFRAELNLPLVRTRVSGQELRASGRAVLDERGLLVSDLAVRYAGIESVFSRFTVDPRQGAAGTAVVISGNAGGRPVSGRLSAEVGLTPINSWLDFGKALDSFSGRADVTDFTFADAEPQNFNIAFGREDGVVSVRGGPRNMFRMQSDSDGNFYAALSSPFPVRGTIAGRISDNTIDARSGDLFVDLAELFTILPESPQIFLTGGIANAVVEIRGPVSDPEFYGTIRGTSLRMRVPQYIPQELRLVPFTAVLDGNEIHFGPVWTAVGNGAGTVSGRFLFNRWIPNTFSLDISVPRESPIPYSFNISGFIADGDAHGNINISMENMALYISGDLFANNTEMSVNLDTANRGRVGAAASAPRIPSFINLNVLTGPSVEFFYPNPRFPILRANPEMGTRIHVTANTLEEQFSVTGDVNVRGGEIFYFERSFYIRSGVITFRENEHNFSPRISARAETRDRIESGPVTISMVVDNAPLQSFTARFESTPHLSQMEIFTLLGQTFAGAPLDDSFGLAPRAAITTAADIATQFFVVRQVEQVIRNFTGLDMFSVRTQALQNFIFSQAGIIQAPVDRIGGLGNYFNNTTFLGGKYIGQDMFIQGMLSMRYDANRLDTWGLTLEPDIGVELQSPLFDIRWSFVPTHPENWFVNDNAITLFRRWVF